MNILAVLLPLLMSLMVGFGGIAIIRMMHGIIHGRGDVTGQMMDHFRSQGKGMAGGAADSPLAAGLAAVKGAKPTAPEGSGGAATGNEHSTAEDAGDLVGAPAADATSGTTAPDGGENTEHDGGEEHSEESADDDRSEAPAAEAGAVAAGAVAAGASGGHPFLSAAGKGVGKYRSAADGVRRVYGKVAPPLKTAKLYAKSTRTAYLGRAIIQGKIVDAPSVFMANYPRMKADAHFRHQQMAGLAHTAVQRKLGPYIPDHSGGTPGAASAHTPTTVSEASTPREPVPDGASPDMAEGVSATTSPPKSSGPGHDSSYDSHDNDPGYGM